MTGRCLHIFVAIYHSHVVTHLIAVTFHDLYTDLLRIPVGPVYDSPTVPLHYARHISYLLRTFGDYVTHISLRCYDLVLLRCGSWSLITLLPVVTIPTTFDLLITDCWVVVPSCSPCLPDAFVVGRLPHVFSYPYTTAYTTPLPTLRYICRYSLLAFSTWTTHDSALPLVVTILHLVFVGRSFVVATPPFVDHVIRLLRWVDSTARRYVTRFTHTTRFRYVLIFPYVVTGPLLRLLGCSRCGSYRIRFTVTTVSFPVIYLLRYLTCRSTVPAAGLPPVTTHHAVYYCSVIQLLDLEDAFSTTVPSRSFTLILGHALRLLHCLFLVLHRSHFICVAPPHRTFTV